MKGNDIANGVKIRIVKEGKNRKAFVIEYLKDGQFLGESECIIRTISQQEFEEVRRELLKDRVGILKIKMEKSSEREATSNSVIGAINDFKMMVKDIPLSKKKDVTIEFLESGLLITQTNFRDVDLEKIDDIRKMLIDNTRYNLAQVQLCRTIGLVEMLYGLEQIRLSK